MSARRRPRIGPRTAFAATAALGGVAAAAALQRRHLHTLAHDPDYVALSAPLGGRPLRIASRDGTELHAEAFGAEADPTVVLGHGWTEQLSFWGPVIRRLTDRGLRPVAYDLRGHGRSAPAADGDYSLDRFGEDLEAVLAAVTPEGERATAVGHSLGAMSIAAWARHHDVEARLRAAALINTGFGELASGHLLFGALAKWVNHPWASRAVLGSRAPVPAFSTPVQESIIRHIAFGPDATPGQIAFYEHMLVDTPPDVRAAVGVVLSDMDLWDAVARLTVPTLVIAGDNDRLTPPAQSRRIAAELPQPAGLLELEDTGHMSPIERPREVSVALTRLVREPAAAPAGSGGRI
jgi:pimeloyl-ACP methyl ester carboxylesterase